MNGLTYTIDNSQTVRAYLPDGTVLEAWDSNGWVQVALHPQGPLTHQRTDAEESISREEFAATYNSAQLQLQTACALALPLDMVAFIAAQ